MARKKQASLWPPSRPPEVSEADWKGFLASLADRDEADRKRRARYRRFPRAKNDEWLDLVLIILEDARVSATGNREQIARIEDAERTIRDGNPWRAAIRLLRIVEDETFSEFQKRYGALLDSALASRWSLRMNRHVPSRDPDVQEYVELRGRELLNRGRDRRELAGIIYREMTNLPPEKRRSLGTVRRVLKAAGL